MLYILVLFTNHVSHEPQALLYTFAFTRDGIAYCKYQYDDAM